MFGGQLHIGELYAESDHCSAMASTQRRRRTPGVTEQLGCHDTVPMTVPASWKAHAMSFIKRRSVAHSIAVLENI